MENSTELHLKSTTNADILKSAREERLKKLKEEYIAKTKERLNILYFLAAIVVGVGVIFAFISQAITVVLWILGLLFIYSPIVSRREKLKKMESCSLEEFEREFLNK